MSDLAFQLLFAYVSITMLVGMVALLDSDPHDLIEKKVAWAFLWPVLVPLWVLAKVGIGFVLIMADMLRLDN